MKEYGFSNISKIQMRKQLSNIILLTTLIFIVAIGMYIKNSVFYGRLFLVTGGMGLIIMIMIISKIRKIDDIFYIKVYKNKIELNSNIQKKAKVILFKDISDVRTNKKGMLITAGGRQYRILKGFLEKDQWQEVWSKLTKI